MKTLPTAFCSLLLAIASLPSLADAEPGRLGVMIDAGVPDGLTGSLVMRAHPAVSVHAGAGHNLISPGLRAGVSVQPIPWWFRPSLNLEAGHYFPGNANEALRTIGATDAEEDHPMLSEVGYSYANFHLGLELGRSRATFYIHAGFSAIQSEIRNINESFDDQSDDMGGGTTVEVREDPVVTLWTPSARLGLIVFL